MGVKDEQKLGRGRNKPASVQRRAARGGDSQFVNIELSQEQTVTMRQWREDVSNVDSAWARALESGYRLNTKWDDYNNCCAAYLIPDEQSDNSGYLLSGRGGTPYRAVCEVLYKHTEILLEQWGSGGAGPERSDDPDF